MVKRCRGGRTRSLKVGKSKRCCAARATDKVTEASQLQCEMSYAGTKAPYGAPPAASMLAAFRGKVRNRSSVRGAIPQ